MTIKVIHISIISNSLMDCKEG